MAVTFVPDCVHGCTEGGGDGCWNECCPSSNVVGGGCNDDEKRNLQVLLVGVVTVEMTDMVVVVGERSCCYLYFCLCYYHFRRVKYRSYLQIHDTWCFLQYFTKIIFFFNIYLSKQKTNYSIFEKNLCRQSSPYKMYFWSHLANCLAF